ncbi:MAG: magnesium transporter MgtE N-terminal domain-containing protein [Acidimicrobiales bacterium]
MQLSALLGSHILSPSGESVGKVDDVIVRLRGGDYPVVTGLVAKVGRSRVFLPIGRIGELSDERVALAKPKVDLRAFERREGEVLLSGDILGHRLIDVADAELVRAWDIELHKTDEGWILSSLDTRRPARLMGLIRRAAGSDGQDWKDFEALIGHTPSSLARKPFKRVRRLKAAQIADLLEEASRNEGKEILDAVHADPELEADVFEELDPDIANRLFGDRTDAQVADVIARMHADDAADAIAELPQIRRQRVLDCLPPGKRAKVLTLLGFNPTSAGGIMGVEFMTAAAEMSAEKVLDRIRKADTMQPEALVTVHCVDEHNHLVGTASVVRLLHADPGRLLADVADTDPVRVGPDTDVVDVAVLMADYNLMTIPVVGSDNQLLGVITVDDILEATIPDDWRRREPPPHPDQPPSDPVASGSTSGRNEPRG